MMQKKRWLFLLPIALAAIAGMAWWMFAPKETPATTSEQTQSATVAPEPATAPVEDLERIETALESGDPKAQAEAFTSLARNELLQQGKVIFPMGTVVEFDDSTFVPLTATEPARVLATVTKPGEPAATWEVQLLQEGDKWFVYTTEKR